MNILFKLIMYLNIIILGLAALVASPMLIIMFFNVICIKYLQSKPSREEHFKDYCWTLYVINCTERSDEGEGLITFTEYMENNKEYLQEKYRKILKGNFNGL